MVIRSEQDVVYVNNINKMWGFLLIKSQSDSLIFLLDQDGGDEDHDQDVERVHVS